MSEALLELNSATALVELHSPAKGDNFAMVDGGRAILLTPKLTRVETPDDIQWISVPPSSMEFESTFSPNLVRAPTIRYTRRAKAQEFRTIRKYDGVILKREQESFWARLRETPSQYPTIEAEFGLSELASDSDRELAVEGIPIVWTLGFGRDHGTWKRESILYVRRLLPASKEELEQSRTQVREMMSGITWE